MKINVLKFDISIGKKKPETIIHQNNPCPFCNVAGLNNIIAQKDEFIFLRNKYNVLSDSDQFVLIESANCNSDMPDYTLKYMQELMKFALINWRALLHQGYEAVLFFKNHGHLSGGTIKHPHMQMIGLNKIDSTLLFDTDDFSGTPISSENNVELSLAKHPRLGFGEFNILVNCTLEEIIKDNSPELVSLSKFIKFTVEFICVEFIKCQTSYNIFFYYKNQKIYVKIMPRFPTSPLFIGYDIRLLPNNHMDMTVKMAHFLKKKKI